MMKFGAVLLFLTLSGCGAAYFSPTVEEGVTQSGTDVRVIPLTPQTILTANQSAYTPRPLPAVFFQSASGGSGLRGTGALPPPAFKPQNRPKTIETRLPPTPPQTPYEIGIGDVLLLATPQASSSVAELSGLLAAQNKRQGYTVQGDGTISIPDVGRIQVAGLSLQDAEAEVFQKLVENQIDPMFSLEVAEFNSQRIPIGGAVNNPTVVSVGLTPLYLGEALSAAGGVALKDQDYAAIRLYRDGALYQIPVKDLYNKKELQRIRLVGGDSLFVDTDFELDKAQGYFAEQIRLAEFRQSSRAQALENLQAEISLQRSTLQEQRRNFEARVALDAVARDYVYLTGEVLNQARFALAFERKTTLADALYDTGGFATRTGNPAQIYILRGSPDPAEANRITAWHMDARNAANFILATRMELRPNDVIFISEQPITKWNRVLTQFGASLVNSTVAGAVK